MASPAIPDYCCGGDPITKTQFNDTERCFVLAGEACPYFREAILPLASQQEKGKSIIYQYELIDPKLKQKKVKAPRKCICGKVLLSRQRYCEKCRAKRNRANKRSWKNNNMSKSRKLTAKTDS